MVNFLWYASFGAAAVYWACFFLLTYYNRHALPWEQLTMKSPIIMLGIIGHVFAITGFFV